VTDDFSGLRILDVSMPAAPAIVASLRTPGTAGNVAVVGPFAFVADEFYGVQVVFIGTTEQIEPSGGLDPPGYARRAAATATHL